MSQQRSSEGRSRAASPGRGSSQFIEKGWTVSDALERPLGNVTDVDAERDTLHIDGRAIGFGDFAVPLSLVASAGSNEVRLSKALDSDSLAEGATPRFVDPPSASMTTGTTRTTSATTTAAASGTARTRSRAETVSTGARSRAGGATTEPLGEDDFRTFTPPYADPASGGKAPTWRQDEVSEGWSAKSIAMAGLALGGLAATTYLMRRRMRRKTRMERLTDAAMDAFGATSAFARERHPAWWASLAAAALPVAYYAWPSRKPTYTERARGRADDFASSLGGLAAMLPFTSDTRPAMTERMRRQLPDRMPFLSFSGAPLWGDSSRRSDWDWSPKPDLAGTAGALAAGALGLYLLRRMMAKPASSRRIADVMTRQPRVIQPDATVADAATMMRRLDIGALPVCDGSRLIGMLTDRDITTRATADGRDPYLTPVRDVMSPGVAWATEDDLVDEAARIMREHRIRRLPIVNERHTLVGVVSLGDLAVDVNDDDLSGETLERISEPSRPDRTNF